MIGAYRVRVRNKRNAYDFTLRRNITILRGDSGRGKTTLFDMIAEYGRLGRASGVSVACDRPLIALMDENWEEKIARTTESIIVIDEDSTYLRSENFARAVRDSSDYFLLITRDYLSQLPYSVDEIYQLHGRKNKTFVPVYSAEDHIYDHPARSLLPFHPDLIITEDSGSGYQFFSSVAADAGMECIAAHGKSNIYQMMRECDGRKVVIIADGAAFGADMANVVLEQRLRPASVAIFLPESFEWIVLASGAAGHAMDVYLMHPEEYLESGQYMSWERYFTDVLIHGTTNSSYMKYSKEKLPAYYTQEKVKQEICGFIQGIRF